MVPTVTAYDVIIRVRYSGESTTAKGWIQLEGECRRRAILVVGGTVARFLV